jgi:hypothetical protein
MENTTTISNRADPIDDPKKRGAAGKGGLLDFEQKWAEIYQRAIEYRSSNSYHEYPDINPDMLTLDLELYTLSSIRKVVKKLNGDLMTWERYQYDYIYEPNADLINRYCGAGKALNLHRVETRQNLRLTGMFLGRHLGGQNWIVKNFLISLYTLLRGTTPANDHKCRETFTSYGDSEEVDIDPDSFLEGGEWGNYEHTDAEISTMSRTELSWILQCSESISRGVYNDHFLDEEPECYLYQDYSEACIKKLEDVELKELELRCSSLGINIL